MRDNSAPWTPTMFHRAILSEQDAVYNSAPCSGFNTRKELKILLRQPFHRSENTDLVECSGQLNITFNLIDAKVSLFLLHFHSEFAATKYENWKLWKVGRIDIQHSQL